VRAFRVRARRAGNGTKDRATETQGFESLDRRQEAADPGVIVFSPPSGNHREGFPVRTLTVANQKGGCGKTTVAINLAASLAKEGRRVLLIDLDPQAHCALGTAVPDDQIDLSILDCLLGQLDGKPIELSRITWNIAPNLDLAPSRSNLAALEPRLGTNDQADRLLSDLLAANSGRHDFCVVDCPPHWGLLMRNGLRAADEALIPVDTGFFSLHGLTHQLASIDKLSESATRTINVRILPNQYDVRTKHAREVLAELNQRFRGRVSTTVVNFNTKLREGASFGQPITEFAPNSIGARDFQRLAQEILESHPASAPTTEMLKHVEKLAADAERLLATTTTLIQGRRPTGPVASVAASSGVALAGVASADPFVDFPPPTAVSTAPASPGAPKPGTPRRPAESAPMRSAPPTQGNSPPLSAPLRSMTSSAVASTASVAPRSTGSPRSPFELADEGGSSSANPGNSTPTAPPRESGRSEAFRSAATEPSSAEEIDRKIEMVYGVRQESDVVIFRSRNPNASEVQLAGDFNDWMPHTTPMRRLPDGDFETRLRLPRGRYRYRLVVDGRWSHDVYNPTIETNEYGELNSVLEIIQ